MAAAAIVLSSTSLKAQTVPELVFKNAVLTTGGSTSGKDNAVYWFKNVATGIDAMVKITGRSSSNVTLDTVDLKTTGFDNSFQPVIDYTGGTNYKNNVTTEWYMEFKVYFVKSSDTSQAVSVTGFDATGLDIDGSSSLHERAAFYGLSSYTVETGSTLTVTNSTTSSGMVGKQFEAGNTEYSGIDVTATKAMATAHYTTNTNVFYLRLGGWAKGSINIDNGGRQYSIWFKSFTYTTPQNAPVSNTLPVDLLSFTARLNNKATVLDWTTANEKDFSNFVIQRSTDGSSFDDVSVIFTDESNTSNVKKYSYTDNAAVQSTLVYYRLKMVDQDGKFTYSPVEMVRKASNDQAQASILVYPNPVVTDLRVTIPDSWQGKNVSYTIYNSNGNVIRQKINNQAGQTEVLNVSGAPAGIYMIKVTQGTETTTKQFVKQN